MFQSIKWVQIRRFVSSHLGAVIFDCFDVEQTGTISAFAMWHFVSAMYGTQRVADLEVHHIHAALSALGQLHNGSLFTLRRYNVNALVLARHVFAMAWEMVRTLFPH
jgi:hypothetical protein